MDFISNHKIKDVNFHVEEIRYCKIMGCTNILCKRSNLLSHNRMEQSMKMEMEYTPFWDILKINAVRELQVCMANYSRRFNILRIESTNIVFTKDEKEVEQGTNRNDKVRRMIGELRIRREDDDVPKDYVPKQVITKSKEKIE
jgi:hypothetical protein